MLDDLPEIAADAFGSCFPGCVLSLTIPVCAVVAAIAFATGDAHEAWTAVAVGGLCVLWALGAVGRWWWRRSGP